MVGNNASAAQNVGKPGSVQALYGVCKSPDIKIMSRCAAYIQGFGGAMMYMVGQASDETSLAPDGRNALSAFGLCHQGMVTVPEMIQTFLNWSEQNPKEWDSNGEFGVLASLREAWPCK
jgi:hypothetical protein